MQVFHARFYRVTSSHPPVVAQCLQGSPVSAHANDSLAAVSDPSGESILLNFCKADRLGLRAPLSLTCLQSPPSDEEVDDRRKSDNLVEKAAKKCVGGEHEDASNVGLRVVFRAARTATIIIITSFH